MRPGDGESQSRSTKRFWQAAQQQRGFCAALALPATESPLSKLWLGLPARAAIVIYGIGLLPIIVLPVAYALTFETQTLNAEDVERVRELARENRARSESQTS